MGSDSVEPADPAVLGLGRAFERFVISLPPKERACVLLKDVFDYTLEFCDLFAINATGTECES